MSQSLRFSRFEVLQHPDGSPQVLGEDTEITIYLAREKESGTPAGAPGISRGSPLVF